MHITRPGCKVNKLRELAVLRIPVVRTAISYDYDYFKRTYKNHKEMLKRYAKDEEEWYEKAKYDEEICFDPDGLNDLKKTKEQYSNYFENE